MAIYGRFMAISRVFPLIISGVFWDFDNILLPITSVILYNLYSTWLYRPLRVSSSTNTSGLYNQLKVYYVIGHKPIIIIIISASFKIIVKTATPVFHSVTIDLIC